MKEKPNRAVSPGSRLGPLEWIEAALSLLAQGGVNEVRVEVLAKVLAVTKGSFYWHFRDRDDLLARLLDTWMEGRLESITTQFHGTGGSSAERLRKVLDVFLDHTNPKGLAIEMAIRDWARRDRNAWKRVRQVDAERLRLVSSLFSQMGYSKADAGLRAVTYYSFLFGQALLAMDVPPFGDKRRRATVASLLIGETK